MGILQFRQKAWSISNAMQFIDQQRQCKGNDILETENGEGFSAIHLRFETSVDPLFCHPLSNNPIPDQVTTNESRGYSTKTDKDWSRYL